MSLKNFIKSMQKGEVLLPILRDFLASEADRELAGTLSRKEKTTADAKLSIKCFQDRIAEFNHGEDPQGEFFHPSAIGQCMRKLVYDVFGAPPDHAGKTDGAEELRKHLTFECGTYMHVMLQNLCARAGLLLKREVAIIDKMRKIIGHADGILRLHGLRYILEIKTINTVGLSKMDGPKHEHKAQAHAYMAALKVKRTVFVYFDKDKAQIREYVIEYDHQFYLDHVRRRIRKFFRHVRHKTIPDREGTNPRAYPCMFCQYQRVCWESQLEKKFAKDIKKLKYKHDK